MRTDVNSIYYDGSDDSNYELDCDDILFIICVSLSSSWVKVAAATAAQQQQQKLPKERAASDPVGHWPLSNQLLLFFFSFFSWNICFFLRTLLDGRALFSHFPSSSNSNRGNISYLIEQQLQSCSCMSAATTCYFYQWKSWTCSPSILGTWYSRSASHHHWFSCYIWFKDVSAFFHGAVLHSTLLANRNDQRLRSDTFAVCM